jgi:hypothetical protein
MATRRLDSLYRKYLEFRARRSEGGSRAPAFVQRGTERWERTTIPWPRTLGLAVGIVGLLVLLLLSQLVFGGTDLGEDGPASNPYFEQ